MKEDPITAHIRRCDTEVAYQQAMSELLFLRGRWLLRSLYRGHLYRQGV